MDLRDDPDRCALLGRRQSGALTGEAGSYYENVVFGHLREGAPGILGERHFATRARGGASAGGGGRAEHPADPLEGPDPAQDAVAIHRHDRAEALEALAAEERLERLLRADAQRAVARVMGHDRGDD